VTGWMVRPSSSPGTSFPVETDGREVARVAAEKHRRPALARTIAPDGLGSYRGYGELLDAVERLGERGARIREIGTLRAIGFSRRSVLLSFVLEALLLCLIGGILGTALAFVLFNLVITKPTGTMNFRTFSEILFHFRITPPLVLGGLAFSLAMGLFGGFFPAARAARLKITTALREI